MDLTEECEVESSDVTTSCTAFSKRVKVDPRNVIAAAKESTYLARYL